MMVVICEHTLAMNFERKFLLLVVAVSLLVCGLTSTSFHQVHYLKSDAHIGRTQRSLNGGRLLMFM